MCEELNNAIQNILPEVNLEDIDIDELFPEKVLI
jgi:division protein CdvB (Snf7/Vps24/ESCRT-III family)